MASTAQSSHVSASHARSGPELDNRRIAAAAIDLAAPALALLALMAGGLLTPAVALVLVGWTLFYFFALESGDGQTLGKRAMRLRVVSTAGRPPTMRQYAFRNLVRLFDLPVVGLLAMIASGERRQRLGDRAAQTMVVDADSAMDGGDSMAETLPDKTATAAPQTAKPRRSRPSLGGPQIRMPKRPTFSRSRKAKPVSAVADAPAESKSPAVPDAKPRGSRRTLGGPEIKLPTLRRKKSPLRAVEPAPAVDPPPEAQSPAPAARAPIPVLTQTPEAEAVPQAEPVPEIKPFDPFDADAPSPTIEVVRPGEEPEPGPQEPLPEATVPEDEEVPDVQVVRDPEYAPEPLRAPAIPAIPAPAIPAIPQLPAEQPLSPAASANLPEVTVPGGEEASVPEAPIELSGAVRDDGSSRLNVKPIETVSPLELLMQEAEEHQRPGGDSSL